MKNLTKKDKGLKEEIITMNVRDNSHRLYDESTSHVKLKHGT